MNDVRVIVAVISFLACSCVMDSLAAHGDSQVHKSYAELKEAVRQGNGKVAASHVSPKTIQVYERCRALAIDSSGTDYDSLSQIEVILIFQLRWLLSKQQLDSMNGATLFAWAVENGLVRKQSFDNIEIDSAQVEGTKAMASVLNQGKKVPDLIFDFELQNGVWKLDYGRILSIANAAYDKVRKDSGKSKIELSVYLLEKTYQQDIPPQILNGPLK